MRTLQFVVTFALIWPVAESLAADDRRVNVQSVELHTIADGQFGPMTIRATASDDRHVQSLSLTYQSRTVNVPAEGLGDLRDVDIGSLHVTVVSDHRGPWLLLEMKSYDAKYMKIPGQPATISFVIDNGEVVRRSIMWQTKSGQPYSDDKRLKRSSTQ